MKIKVGVFFGGKSVEHEISVITMNQAINSLNPDKYEIVPIYIAKNGVMYTGDDLLDLYSFKDMDVLLKRCYRVSVVNNGKVVEVRRYPATIFGKQLLNTIDVAFPIVHGTNCEDGTIAGFVTLLGIPYVGPDIMASSIGMDKILQKKVWRHSGIPVVDFAAFYSLDYVKDEEAVLKDIHDKVPSYPMIVKPGNLGSSVGIKKVDNKAELQEAIEFAMEFSDRIIVEKAVENLKEINCSIIGNLSETTPSVLEEPYFSDEILSYADKYIGNGKSKGGSYLNGASKSAKIGTKGSATKGGNSISGKRIPADLSEDMTKEIQKIAQEAYRELGCSGVARVDFLIDTKTNKVYVNEINTIPGALSYYLWEATGMTFEEELDKLIEIAIKRHNDKDKLTFSYDQNILAMQGGTKGSKGLKGSKGKI